jgi:hypothetical protein
MAFSAVTLETECPPDSRRASAFRDGFFSGSLTCGGVSFLGPRPYSPTTWNRRQRTISFHDLRWCPEFGNEAKAEVLRLRPGTAGRPWRLSVRDVSARGSCSSLSFLIVRSRHLPNLRPPVSNRAVSPGSSRGEVPSPRCAAPRRNERGDATRRLRMVSAPWIGC